MSLSQIVAPCVMIAVALGGCGLLTPEKDLFTGDEIVVGDPSPRGLFENRIVAHIRCEIRNGLFYARKLPNVEWLDTWGTTVTLKLTVEDLNGLSPGASFISPLVQAQSFTLGLGASGTANATRLETIAFSYSNAKLIEEAKKDIAKGPLSCSKLQDGVMIQSDLKIGQFIYDKATISSTGEATSKHPNTPPFSTLQEDITFVATVGVSATPTWKLTRVTVNPSSTLVSLSRMRTDDVLITLGPLAAGAKGKSQPLLSGETLMVHYAGLIGSATASAINAQLPAGATNALVP
jgi:hypothetical protein